MTDPRYRKILQMISSGKISADQGDKLLAALEQKKHENRFVMQLISSRQDVPCFEFALPVSKIIHLQNLINKLSRSDFTGKFHMGSFKLNLSNLNWERIFELIHRGEQSDLLILEMPASQNVIMTFRIAIE